MFKELINFKNSKEWIMFENYYNRPSFLNQVDFFRFEDLHTNFIASLLDKNNVYGLGDYPLRLLIELIAYKKDDKFDTKEILKDYSIEYIGKPETQKQITAGRLDMFIQFKINSKPYLIVFEDKLYSSEGLEQCLKYSKEINGKKEYEDYNKIYIYLSLNDNVDISDNEYIQITYNDLMNKVLIPCSLRDESKNLILTIDEYIKGFVALYEQDDIDYRNIPIAIEGEELTLKVWEKHKNLIKELLIDNDCIDEFNERYNKSLRILFINLLNIKELSDKDGDFKVLKNKIIKEVAKERNIFKSIPYKNSELIFEVLKDIISNNENITSQKLNELAISGWRIVISKSDIENEPRKEYYRLDKSKYSKERLKINGEEYYYCYKNSGPDIETFVDKVKNNYPEYVDKIERV